MTCVAPQLCCTLKTYMYHMIDFLILGLKTYICFISLLCRQWYSSQYCFVLCSFISGCGLNHCWRFNNLVLCQRKIYTMLHMIASFYVSKHAFLLSLLWMILHSSILWIQPLLEIYQSFYSSTMMVYIGLRRSSSACFL